MEEPFKTLREKSLKRKESLNLDTKMLQKKYNNLKQLLGKLRDKKKMALFLEYILSTVVTHVNYFKLIICYVNKYP